MQAIASKFVKDLLTSRLLDADAVRTAQRAVEGDDRALANHLVEQGLLTRFQAKQLLAGQTAFRVEKYVILDCLGRGSHGIVFKARHSLIPNRCVAIKTIDTRSLHRSQETQARFRREIEIVTRLDHPNVVRALDVLMTRNNTYLVLEYVEGRDLGTLVKERGPLPVPEACGYALQAARGLGYAHRCGIIHRDLKPANLLLTKDNVVKLTDLGLARFTHPEPEAELTLQGSCLGTPEFMAPEQAEDAAQADERSDLHGLGATLFHLLTAELPVKGSSYLHCLQKLLMSPARPLAEARPDVPPSLAALVDRLRARNPADRPQTAEEVVALLKPFAEGTEDPRAWDGKRKAALVLEVLTGQLSAADACSRYGLTTEEMERWRQRFLAGAEMALNMT
jgi:eukaryotic-like serine/threonine-protein kinase